MTSPEELLEQLHQAARRARGPAPVVRRQVLHELSKRLRGCGSMALSAGAGGVKLSVVLAVVFLAVMAVLREPIGAGGVSPAATAPAVVRDEPPPDLEPSPVLELPPETTPMPNTIHVPRPPASDTPTATHGLRRSRTRQGSPDPSAAPPAPSITAEINLIRRMSVAMANQQMQTVLELVVAHELRFPNGALLEEREAARARATCRLGDVAAGGELARQFGGRWPTSMQLDAVMRDCKRRSEP